MDQKTFQKAIDDLGLSSFRGELERLALPCLDFLTEVAGEPVPSSESKIGGMPDLPEGVAWPVTPGDHQVPLLFLGRVAAKDASRIYPEIQHHLLFFAEWIYGRDGVVLEIPVDAETFPVEFPPRPADACPPLTECRVKISENVSIPDHQSEPERGLYSEELLHFGEVPDPFWGEQVMRPVIEKLVYQSSRDPDKSHGLFRFGGYPSFTQAHPIDNASLDPDLEGITDWCQLMSFGSDEPTALSYGDTGFCGFMTTRSTLASGSLSFVSFYQDSL